MAHLEPRPEQVGLLGAGQVGRLDPGALDAQPGVGDHRRGARKGHQLAASELLRLVATGSGVRTSVWTSRMLSGVLVVKLDEISWLAEAVSSGILQPLVRLRWVPFVVTFSIPRWFTDPACCWVVARAGQRLVQR